MGWGQGLTLDKWIPEETNKGNVQCQALTPNIKFYLKRR